MPVLMRVCGEQMLDTAGKSVGRIECQPQLDCQAVGSLKADALDLLAKHIGVAFGDVNRTAAPLFVDAHRSDRSEILAEEKHCRANARLVFELLGDRAGALGCDAVDFCQPIRVIFNDVKGLLTKRINNALRGFWADALDGTRAEIAKHRCLVGKQLLFGLLYLKLSPVFGIVHPLAPHCNKVALTNVGERTRDGNKIVGVGAEIANGISVFIIGVNHTLNAARKLYHADLVHGSLHKICIKLCHCNLSFLCKIRGENFLKEVFPTPLSRTSYKKSLANS